MIRTVFAHMTRGNEVSACLECFIRLKTYLLFRRFIKRSTIGRTRQPTNGTKLDSEKGKLQTHRKDTVEMVYQTNGTSRQYASG